VNTPVVEVLALKIQVFGKDKLVAPHAYAILCRVPPDYKKADVLARGRYESKVTSATWDALCLNAQVLIPKRSCSCLFFWLVDDEQRKNFSHTPDMCCFVQVGTPASVTVCTKLVAPPHH